MSMVRPTRIVVLASFLMGLALPYVWGAATTKKAAVPVKKGAVTKAPTKSAAVVKGTAKKTAARPVVVAAGKKRVASRSYAKTGKRVVAAPIYRGQGSPTPDRYQEIQQALIDKGYMQGTPSGSWDAQTTDAMRRFQTEKHLPASGQLNSMSLIQLGLGPKRLTATNTAPAPPVLSPVPTVQP